ncbi:MAG: hypothetical protein KME64_29105 [Scytonematopsis contorta HA4267-MV1]|jgi:hypothetical protein|nr:hypothetical protein [Scytonematopsis contorta HA4267-MV1]
MSKVALRKLIQETVEDNWKSIQGLLFVYKEGCTVVYDEETGKEQFRVETGEDYWQFYHSGFNTRDWMEWVEENIPDVKGRFGHRVLTDRQMTIKIKKARELLEWLVN